ncbi:conserved hypothetical protein [Myxococcus xanthus DK 1622]|uniref:Uncharacterized protein n=1 Tax=Myxococcus xanthus (strain DK1622) TaxID=246197 RepID=Q1CW10_MYXXD|nr:conserved hypothetical protein [Myxococcus xanthus DK 1622]
MAGEAWARGQKRRSEDQGKGFQKGVTTSSPSSGNQGPVSPPAESTWKSCAGMKPCPSSATLFPAALAATSSTSTACPGLPPSTKKSPGRTSSREGRPLRDSSECVPA